MHFKISSIATSALRVYNVCVFRSNDLTRAGLVLILKYRLTQMNPILNLYIIYRKTAMMFFQQIKRGTSEQAKTAFLCSMHCFESRLT